MLLRTFVEAAKNGMIWNRC